MIPFSLSFLTFYSIINLNHEVAHGLLTAAHCAYYFNVETSGVARLHPAGQSVNCYQHQNQAVPRGLASVQNISMITNQSLSKLLLADVFQDDDEDRTLTSIDVTSCNQIFLIFNLKPPLCDQNGDGIVDGLELKCLN